MAVFSVTATTDGSVVSIKVTPTSSGTTDIKWVREAVRSRIGGITVEDDGSYTFASYTNADNGAIPVGKAYIYLNAYWDRAIDFAAQVGNNITFDSTGVGPQNPAVGNVDSWDGYTLIVTIVSGTFTARSDFDKITYGY
jgi:hypothetical protein